MVGPAYGGPLQSPSTVWPLGPKASYGAASGDRARTWIATAIGQKPSVPYKGRPASVAIR